MIVSVFDNYSYELMISNIYSLKRKYPFLNLGYIGYSVLGNAIPYIKLGFGKKEVFYSASYHANEWITSVVLMKFVEDFCDAYSSGSTLYGYDIYNIFNDCSIYIVPMVNPDGVNLVTGAYSIDSMEYLYAKNIAVNYTSVPFPNGWKANITGVDLKIYQPICKVL